MISKTIAVHVVQWAYPTFVLGSQFNLCKLSRLSAARLVAYASIIRAYIAKHAYFLIVLLHANMI